MKSGLYDDAHMPNWAADTTPLFQDRLTGPVLGEGRML